MAIRFHPPQGAILICDFKGLIPPEMAKRRPVIVISPRFRDIPSGLCTVVPLSTTAPAPKAPFNERITLSEKLPPPYDADHHWIKGDMIYRASFDRLFLFHDGKDSNGKRNYLSLTVSPEELKIVMDCALKSIGCNIEP